MLKRILENVLQLAPDDVYLTHVVKCRPSANRAPVAPEVAACAPFLQRQLEVVRPRLIIALGRLAAQSLTGSSAPLARVRGHWFSYRGIPVICTFDPAAVLNDPALKRPVFEDMKQVKAKLDETRG
jgi:DNA polymerase